LTAVLFDSNILIYSIKPGQESIRSAIAQGGHAASAISVVEVMGYHKLTPAEKSDLAVIFASLDVLAIDAPVIDRAVLLRQSRAVGLGDSIIAATALVHGLTLATHNKADFVWIGGLNVVDPVT
jgi:predicted nucleic acid-binding protein